MTRAGWFGWLYSWSPSIGTHCCTPSFSPSCLCGAVHCLPRLHQFFLQLFKAHKHDDIPRCQSQERRHKPGEIQGRVWELFKSQSKRLGAMSSSCGPEDTHRNKIKVLDAHLSSTDNQVASRHLLCLWLSQQADTQTSPTCLPSHRAGANFLRGQCPATPPFGGKEISVSLYFLNRKPETIRRRSRGKQWNAQPACGRHQGAGEPPALKRLSKPECDLVSPRFGEFH